MIVLKMNYLTKYTIAEKLAMKISKFFNETLDSNDHELEKYSRQIIQ